MTDTGARAGHGPTTTEWVVSIAATAIGLSLYAVFVNHGGALWRDELNGVATASASSWADLWRLLEFESFPPLTIVILRGWLATGAGSSDAGLRVLGALGGFSLLAATWFVLRRFTRNVPLVGLALLAVNPEVVRWGGSVRAWSLGAALILVACVLFREAIDKKSARLIVAAAIVAVLCVQTVYQNAVLVAVLLLCAMAPWIVRRDWARVTVALTIGAVAALSLIPYVHVFAARADWGGVNEWPVSLTDPLKMLWEVMASSGPVAGVVWVLLMAGALVAAMHRAQGRGLRAYLVSVAAFTVVGLGAFYLQLRYPTQRWYYVPVVAIIAVAAEAAVVTISSAAWLRWVRITGAVVVLAASLDPALEDLRAPQTNMDGIAAAIAATAEPGDLIVINPWYYAVSFTHYYRGSVEVMTIPPLADAHVHRYDLVKTAMLDADALVPVRRRIQEVLSSGHRLWFVGDITSPPIAAATVLGLPPLRQTRWGADPYVHMWTDDVSILLRNHVQLHTAVPVPAGGRYETPKLSMLAGWR